MKARNAVHAVAIEERDGGVAERRRAVDERFRKRRALQKAEGGGGVELDIGGHEDWISTRKTQKKTNDNNKVNYSQKVTKTLQN